MIRAKLTSLNLVPELCRRNKLSTLSSKLSTLSSKLNSLSSKLSTLSSKLSTLSSKLNSLSSKLSTLSFLLILTSCQQDFQEPTSEPTLVNVTINLSGFDIVSDPAVTPVPDASASVITRSSDKSASAANVTNIDLSVFDSYGTSVATVSQTSSDSDFGSISLKLPIGTYTFVAVANGANTASTITSSTLATVPENTILYSCSQSETISGNTTQSVSLDMGTRKNACFRIKITDATPSDVDAIQFVFAPTATAPTAITFSPATGLASSTWRYERTYTKGEFNITTFTGKYLSYYFLLPSAETQLDVTINALSAEDYQTHKRTTLYTRTLPSVTFKQANQTTASGTFFSSQSTGSLLFDTAITNSTIPLD